MICFPKCCGFWRPATAWREAPSSTPAGAARREGRVLEAAGSPEGRGVHEAGRRSPEGARNPCWRRPLGSAEGARRGEGTASAAG